MQMMVDSGFIYVVKALEVIGGLLLLSKIKVPIALLVLGPIVVNILLYHAFFDPRNWLISIVNLVLYTVVLLGYQSAFVRLWQDYSPTS